MLTSACYGGWFEPSPRRLAGAHQRAATECRRPVVRGEARASPSRFADLTSSAQPRHESRVARARRLPSCMACTRAIGIV
jgi:hypothetical protein